MTRQVALGAIIGFAVTVIITAAWPHTPPPVPAQVADDGVVHVTDLQPMDLNPPPSALVRPQRPMKFVAVQPQAMPVAKP
jgi:hypothetical protein